MSVKDFSKWHEVKTEINESPVTPIFFRREVWFCAIGLNIGHEEDGKHKYFERPVLIVRKFNSNTFWGVPLSSRAYVGVCRYIFQWKGKNYAALLSQMRLYDASRLRRCIYLMSGIEFRNICAAIRALI